MIAQATSSRPARILVVLLACASLVTCAAADFRKDIAPILAAKCLGCHNAEKSKGGFRLDTPEQLFREGASKKAPIVPGKPEQSLLVSLLQTKDEEDRMPQKDDPLPAAQIAKIVDWIRDGATVNESDKTTEMRALAGPPPRKESPKIYARPLPITALSFLKQGSQLVTSGHHEALVWDSATGALLRRVPNLPERIHALTTDPQERWLAVGGGQPGRSGELWLIRLDRDEPPRLVTLCSDVILTCAFSSDGSLLAEGGADNTIRIFTTADLKQTQVIQQHADWVQSLVFTKDNQRLVSASRDRSARVFLTGTGDLDATFAEHTAAVTGAGLAQEKDTIVSGGKDRRLYLWNLLDGKKTLDLAALEFEIVALESRGSNVLVATANGGIYHFIPPQKSLQGRLDAHQNRAHAIALDPSSALGASGSHDGEVRVWDLDKNSLRIKFIASPGVANAGVRDSTPRQNPILSITRPVEAIRSATNGLLHVPLETGSIRFPKGGHVQGIQSKAVNETGVETLFLSHDSDTVGYIAVADRARTGAGSDRAVVRRIFKLPSDGKQPPLRHAGGIQLFEDLLVVGVEDNQDKLRSQIQFWDVTNAQSPKLRAPLTIARESRVVKRKTAGAVGIANLGTNILVAVANWDSAVLDFYTSNGKPLSDDGCRFDLSWIWNSTDSIRRDWSPDQSWGRYQAINLLTDEAGRLHMAGFHTNTRKQEVVDLFEIDMSAPEPRRLKKVLSVIAQLPDGVHFHYGGGLSIESNNRIRLMATSEFLQANGSIALSP